MKVVNIRMENKRVQMDLNVCVDNIAEIIRFKNDLPLIIIGNPNEASSISIPFDAISYMSVEEIE